MTTITLLISTVGSSARTADRLEGSRPDAAWVDDAAAVDWPMSEDRPSAWQVTLVGSGRRRLSGAFWGLLFAHVFLLPISLADPHRLERRSVDASLSHLGLGPGRLAIIRDLVTPDRSALFVVHADDQSDRLDLAMGRRMAHSAKIRLTPLQSQRLYAGFGETVDVG